MTMALDEDNLDMKDIANSEKQAAVNTVPSSLDTKCY